VDADDLPRRRRRHHEPERLRPPLLMPGVGRLGAVDVATGMMPLDVSAPGMAVTLTPRRPAARGRGRSSSRALHRPSPAAAPRNRRRPSRGSTRSATPASS
jgi:hypothetical protein